MIRRTSALALTWWTWRAVIGTRTLGNVSTSTVASSQPWQSAKNGPHGSVCVHEALESMDPQDREVLMLRHFEQLSGAEVARELGLERSAASKRYVRALNRLRGLLQ